MSANTNILRYTQKIYDTSLTLGAGDLVMEGRADATEMTLGRIASNEDRLVLYISASDGDYEVVLGTVWIDPKTQITTFHREQVLLSSNNNLPVNFESAVKFITNFPELDWQLAILQAVQNLTAAVTGSSGSTSAAASLAVKLNEERNDLLRDIRRELRRLRLGSIYATTAHDVPVDDVDDEY